MPPVPYPIPRFHMVSLAGLAVLIGLALVPRDAWAGAWTQEPGRAQLFVTGGVTGGGMGMLGTGGDAGEGKTWTSVLGEYGLREGLTVGLKFYAETETTEEGTLDGAASLGAYVRKRVWQNAEKGAVASIQIEGQVPVERLLGADLARSAPTSTTELGLRGLYGRSWWGDWGSAFVSTEAAGTWRSEGQSPDLRTQVTVGYQPGDRWMAMLSANGVLPFEDTGTDPSLKISPSVAVHLGQPDEKGRRTSVQLGVSQDVLDSEVGPGVFLSIWRKF